MSEPIRVDFQRVDSVKRRNQAASGQIHQLHTL